MFQRILVPIDTLTDAQPLLEIAGRIAHASQGRVILLHITQPGATAESENQQENQIVHAAPLIGIEVTMHLTEGALVPAIHKTAQQYHVDLIVMGSSCHPGNEHWGRQAITEQVALATTIPTLLIRLPNVAVSVDAAEPLRPFRTLVPLSGALLAEVALLPAALLTATLAGPEGGEIHLVQVVRRLTAHAPASPRETMLPLEDQARLYLAAQAHELQVPLPAERNVRVTWAVVSAMGVAESLTDLATGTERDEQRAEPFDLVVMGVMGPSGGEPFDLSSVASEVLHTTFLPFLVVASRDTPPQTNGRNEA